MNKNIFRKNSLKKNVSIIILLLFSINLFSINVKAETNGMIINNSFKNWLDGWTIKGDTDAVSAKGEGGYDDSNYLNYWSGSAYEVWTEQKITGLENGYYKVEAYSVSGGGQEAIYLYANDFGGTGAKTSIPVSDSFSKVVLNFEVTNNEATIGFYSKGKPGNWSKFDKISITKVEKENKLLKGGDLTMVNLMEDKGAVYYDNNGQPRDVFHILAENGFNIVRLRTHNDTGRATGVDDWYLPDGYQNTEDILKLAKRSKEVGMEIELTLNYSDWWPNAETQEIPSSWLKEIDGLSEEATIDKLEKLIYDYTKDVMTQLANQGTIPEFISLGNEMHTGILFPYGKIGNTENFKRFINAGYKAVKDVSKKTQVILHLDNAGNTEKYTSFFDTCENNGINYDVIGASYYPFWTKKNVEDIIPWFNLIGEKYQKKIMIMETGYNWNATVPSGELGQLKDNGNESHESTPQGQKEFLDELFNGIKNIENNWVIGDLYWDPVMIDNEGVGWAMERGEAADGSEDKAGANVVSNTTIFDFDGKALTALNSFRDNSEGSSKGMLSGLVVGEGGNKISNAKVEINIGSEKYERITDKYGRFFIVGLSGTDGNAVASKNGYSDASETFTIKAAETTNLTIKLGSGSVQGVIKDTEGNLLSGVDVYAKVDGDKIEAFSKEDGTYMLTDLPEGKNFTIYGEKKGYESSSVTGVDVTNKEITKNVNITLKVNSGTINGVVTDNNGKVVEGATVVLISKDGKKYSVTTDASGKYIINYVLSDTDYKITVTKRGYIESTLEGINIENGKTTSDVDIKLQDNFGLINGVVVDSNNNRVAGAEIKVTRNGLEVQKVFSDENGIFEIAEVLDNPDYLVTVSKEGYGEVILSNVVVTPGNSTELLIRMSTPIKVENNDFDNGNLNGWTIDAPQGGVSAQDRTWFNNDAPSGKYALSLWLDKDYTANISQEITGLKPGKYELSAMIYTGGFGKSGSMFVNGEEKKLEKANGWTKVSLPVWIDGDNAKIGFKIDAINGDWAVIDSIEFNYITSIKYDNLVGSISNAKDIEAEEYTPSSFVKLEEKLKIANETLINPEVTQDLVDSTVIELNDAIQSLVRKADKTNLISKVEEAEKVDGSKYTKESFDKLTEAILNAKLVVKDDNVSQENVNVEVELLTKLIENLVEKVEDVEKADKAKLISKVEEAEKVDGSKYTKESFEKLTEAILNAKLVIKDDNASQEKINSEVELLIKAIESLELVIEETPDNNASDNNNNNVSDNNSITNNNVSDNNVSDNNSQILPQTGTGFNSNFIIILGLLMISIGAIILGKKKIVR